MLELLGLDHPNKWQLIIFSLCAFIMMIAIIWGAHRESLKRPPLNRTPHEYEPVLWAEPGSWWKVPIYRIWKFIWIDCVSTAGAFLALMTYLCMQLLPLAFKDAWLVPSVLLALLALACFNFALPKYRGDIVFALVDVVKAGAARLGGWIGTNQSGIPQNTQAQPGTQTSVPPPVPITPPKKV